MASESFPEVCPENAAFVVLHPHSGEHLAILEQRTRERGSHMGDPNYWTVRTEEAQRLYAERLQQVLHRMEERPSQGAHPDNLLFAEPSPHSGGTHYPVLGTPAARAALRQHVGREGALIQMEELFDGIVLSDGTRLSDGYRERFAALCRSRQEQLEAEALQPVEDGAGPNDIIPMTTARIPVRRPPRPRPIVRLAAD